MQHSPSAFYDVVARTEHYAKFVPWCSASRTLSSDEERGVTEVELSVNFGGYEESYVSVVTARPPPRASVRAVSKDTALFRHLVNTWSFAPAPNGCCWVSLKLDFAFKSQLYQHASRVFLDDVARKMVDAFERRCDAVHSGNEH